MSLRESSHPQIEGTYNAIDATIDVRYPPDRIVIYGMSAGGKEALSIAAYLRQKYPKANISIVLSSTPYDQDSAFQLRGSDNNLPLIADISAKLNLHGGPITRLAVEMYNRRDQCETNGYLDIEKFYTLLKKVSANKLSADSSSNLLFEWQVEWTRVNSASGDIATLKNIPGGPFTSILYINTTKDTIVDELEAIPKFTADAQKNDIPLTIMKLDGIHANEHGDPAHYDAILKQYLGSISSIYEGIAVREQESTQAIDSWKRLLPTTAKSNLVSKTTSNK